MILFISIVHVIVCLMLVGIILLQPGRGQGLTGSAFGDTSAQSVFGTKTADVLTKATTVAAVLFMVTCVVLSALTARKTRSLYSNFQNRAPITMNQVEQALKEAEQQKTAAPAVGPTVANPADTPATGAQVAEPNVSGAPAAEQPAAAEPAAQTAA